jgi:hypothetical protein
VAVDRSRPLHARVASDNVASRRVLEKCGFRVVATERNVAEARSAEIEALVLRLDEPFSGPQHFATGCHRLRPLGSINAPPAAGLRSAVVTAGAPSSGRRSQRVAAVPLHAGAVGPPRGADIVALEGASRRRMPSEQMQLSTCSCRESLEPSQRSASRRSPPATSASRASR